MINLVFVQKNVIQCLCSSFYFSRSIRYIQGSFKQMLSILHCDKKRRIFSNSYNTIIMWWIIMPKKKGLCCIYATVVYKHDSDTVVVSVQYILTGVHCQTSFTVHTTSIFHHGQAQLFLHMQSVVLHSSHWMGLSCTTPAQAKTIKCILIFL